MIESSCQLVAGWVVIVHNHIQTLIAPDLGELMGLEFRGKTARGFVPQIMEDKILNACGVGGFFEIGGNRSSTKRPDSSIDTGREFGKDVSSLGGKWNVSRQIVFRVCEVVNIAPQIRASHESDFAASHGGFDGEQDNVMEQRVDFLCCFYKALFFVANEPSSSPLPSVRPPQVINGISDRNLPFLAGVVE